MLPSCYQENCQLFWHDIFGLGSTCLHDHHTIVLYNIRCIYYITLTLYWWGWWDKKCFHLMCWKPEHGRNWDKPAVLVYSQQMKNLLILLNLLVSHKSKLVMKHTVPTSHNYVICLFIKSYCWISEIFNLNILYTNAQHFITWHKHWVEYLKEWQLLFQVKTECIVYCIVC